MAVARTGITPGTRYQPITGRPAFVWAFLDAMVLARRSVLRTLRAPELIVFVAIQPFMLGILVLMGISFAFSWISAFIGLAVRSVEAAQSGGFIWMFPLTFASSAFVPVKTMPSWLQPFAEHNPVTVLSDALRGLFHVNPALTTADTRWALIQSVAWIAAILAVFIPLAVIKYRNSTSR